MFENNYTDIKSFKEAGALDDGTRFPTTEATMEMRSRIMNQAHALRSISHFTLNCITLLADETLTEFISY